MELLAEMQLKGLKPSAVTYSTTISAGNKARQPHKAKELLAEIQQEGLAVNAITFSAASVYFRRPSSLTRRQSSLQRCSGKAWRQTPLHTA